MNDSSQVSDQGLVLGVFSHKRNPLASHLLFESLLDYGWLDIWEQVSMTLVSNATVFIQKKYLK